MPQITFTLDDIEFDLAFEGADGAALAQAIVSSPAGAELVESKTAGEYCTRYSSDSRYSDSDDFVHEIAEAYIGGGMEAVEEHLDLRYDSGAEEERRVRSSMESKFERLDDEFDEITLEISNMHGVNIDAEQLREAFVEAAVDKLIDEDTSEVKDMISSSNTITLAYIPGHADLSIDDYVIQGYTEHLGQLERLIPNQSLAAFFSMCNVPKAEWLAYLAGREIDVIDPSRSADFKHLPEYLRDRAIENGKKWADFTWETDPERPRVKIQDVAEILENSWSACLPTFFLRMDLEDFLKLDLARPITMSPGREGTVGQFGLHDFINGSGHVLGAFDKPVTLPPDGRWYLSEKGKRYGVESVYSMVTSYLTAKPSQDPAPTEDLDIVATSPSP